MEIVLAVILSVAIIFGSCGVILLIGWYATMKVRLDYRLKCRQANFQDKLNAIILEAKILDLDERKLGIQTAKNNELARLHELVAAKPEYPSLNEIEDQLKGN